MHYIDIIILASSVISLLIFVLIWVQRIFNMYIWFILWFFIFLSLALKIELLWFSENISNSFMLNIYQNRDFYLWLTIFMIPLYGIIFSLLTQKSNKSYAISIIFWLLLPFLIIWIIAFISILLWNDFFINQAIYDIVIWSEIFNFFYNNIYTLFFLLFFLISWKITYFIWKILLYFIKWYWKSFYNWIINSKKQVRKEKLENIISKHKM